MVLSISIIVRDQMQKSFLLFVFFWPIYGVSKLVNYEKSSISTQHKTNTKKHKKGNFEMAIISQPIGIFSWNLHHCIPLNPYLQEKIVWRPFFYLEFLLMTTP